MNRHRAYWSMMGIDEHKDTSGIYRIRERKKEALKNIVNYGIGSFDDRFNEVVSILIEIKKESQENEPKD